MSKVHIHIHGKAKDNSQLDKAKQLLKQASSLIASCGESSRDLDAAESDCDRAIGNVARHTQNKKYS